MKLCYLALAAMAGLPAWADTVVYSSLPAPLPPNQPSIGYEADSIGEFGDLVDLATGPAVLLSATVAMSDWALESDYDSHVGHTFGGSDISLAGFTVPLTLTLYNVNGDGSVGLPIGSSYTVDAFIPWRPPPDPADCGTGSTKWLGPDGNCYSGSLSTVTFELPYVSVPGEFIYGLAFNTADHGYIPTGVDGPYVSLNFAVTLADPSAGSSPGRQGYASASSPPMTPVGMGGYIGEIQFDSTPEPAGMALAGMGLLGLCLGLRRARSPGLPSAGVWSRRCPKLWSRVS